MDKNYITPLSFKVLAGQPFTPPFYAVFPGLLRLLRLLDYWLAAITGLRFRGTSYDTVIPLAVLKSN